jgi:hypothetical protein
MAMRILLSMAAALVLMLHHPVAAAQTCDLSFTVVLTKGAGTMRPGMELLGAANFTTEGTSMPGGGGSISHLASGGIRIGDSISGTIWTLVITSEGAVVDLVGVYAHNVEGLSVAGIEFSGPMALTFFGRSGTRPEPIPPVLQEDWDRLDLRRVFSLQAPEGRDSLHGDVTDLMVECR